MSNIPECPQDCVCDICFKKKLLYILNDMKEFLFLLSQK